MRFYAAGYETDATDKTSSCYSFYERPVPLHAGYADVNIVIMGCDIITYMFVE